MERLFSIPADYWGQFAYPDYTVIDSSHQTETPDHHQGKSLKKWIEIRHCVLFNLNVLYGTHDTTLKSITLYLSSCTHHLWMTNDLQCFCSEHIGTIDHSRAPDDGQNPLLQLAVPAHEADPLQHHHVSSLFLSHSGLLMDIRDKVGLPFSNVTLPNPSKPVTNYFVNYHLAAFLF